MDEKPTETAILAWARLIRAEQHVLAGVEIDLKRAGFPPLAWYDLLLELNRCGSRVLRPVEIETRLLLAQHNVSRLIDRVEKSGYVERQRCEEDGRGQLVRLTDKGAALLKEMWPVYRAAIRRRFGSLISEPEAAALGEILAKLLPSRP